MDIRKTLTGIAGNIMAANDFVQVYNRFNTIPGFLGHIEGYALYLFAKDGPGDGEIVEIGSFKGKSTSYLAFGAQQAGRGRVTAIDHFQGSLEHQQGQSAEVKEIVEKGSYYEEFLANIRRGGLLDQVRPVAASSEDAEQGWRNRPIRLLFIDADHTYAGVKRDFELWSRHVPVGGIVAFHDYRNDVHPDVTRFIDEVAAKANWQDLCTIELTKFFLRMS